MSKVISKSISKRKIALYLIVIGLGSLFLKLYLVDFSLPDTGDSWVYILRTMSNSQGYFSETPEKTQGWNMFVSPFFLLTNSNNYIDYVNIMRLVSIAISTLTILPMYLLARKFFHEKYSIIAASFIAFQPQLHYNASIGFSESFFILILIGAFFFILQNKLNKYVLLSFILIGFLFWARFPGIVFILPFIVIFFIQYRHSKNFYKYFVIGILIFIIVISPILLERYALYDNPVYYLNSEFSDSDSILDKFFTGLTNEFHAFVITSIPYLIFLFPIGMFFSLKKYETKKKNYVSVWILFIGSTIPFIMAYSTLDASRMLFHLYPFLIIFSTLAIQQINDKKYKIFSMKKNNIFLTTIIIFMILSSILITFGIDGYGYGRPDAIKTNEIREYGKFLINDLDGKMFWSKGVDSDWIFVVLLEESNGDFKNYKINPYDTLRFKEIESYNSGNFYLLINDELYDNTLEKVILNGEQIGLRYISIGEQNTQSFFDDVYLNEDKYEYLTKIFDSKEQGFQKYKVKAFEIDYKKFHILYEKST